MLERYYRVQGIMLCCSRVYYCVGIGRKTRRARALLFIMATDLGRGFAEILLAELASIVGLPITSSDRFLTCTATNVKGASAAHCVAFFFFLIDSI